MEELMPVFLESGKWEPRKRGRVRSRDRKDWDPRSLGFLAFSAPKIRMTFGCCLQHWV